MCSLPLARLWIIICGICWVLSPVFGFGQFTNDERERYPAVVESIIAKGRENRQAHLYLQELCDGIGNRISGSESLNRAIDWAVATMQQAGHENVRAEPVTVNYWQRGSESCEMLVPRNKSMSILGLGGSIATPDEGIEADVVVVDSKEELDKLDDETVKGKIVVFNPTMPPYSEERGSGYGAVVAYRTNGARWAAERGAVAALVRSATAYSLNSPHTGAMRYAPDVPKVPTASITIEDALLLKRLQQRGKSARVKLKLSAQDRGDMPSANVLAEIVGSELPDEVVVIGGHIDSWDVGQGAQDDGAGCVAAMEALRILRSLGLKPRRTIRVVLWTDEERGGAGANAYAAKHQLERHIAGIESDSGGFTPSGLSLEVAEPRREQPAIDQANQIMSWMLPLGRLAAKAGGSGADVSKLKPLGTVCLGLQVDGRLYFNTHHTEADTVDKVDPDQLQDCAIVLAVAAYVLADMKSPVGSDVGSDIPSALVSPTTSTTLR